VLTLQDVAERRRVQPRAEHGPYGAGLCQHRDADRHDPPLQRGILPRVRPQRRVEDRGLDPIRVDDAGRNPVAGVRRHEDDAVGRDEPDRFPVLDAGRLAAQRFELRRAGVVGRHERTQHRERRDRVLDLLIDGHRDRAHDLDVLLIHLRLLLLPRPENEDARERRERQRRQDGEQRKDGPERNPARRHG
jgi:hypothetical protein